MDDEMFEKEDSGEEKTYNLPKPRKHMRLYQHYSIYDELSMMGVRHKNRLKAIQSGRSDMDSAPEESLLEWLIPEKHRQGKILVMIGEEFGETWAWLTSIKGLKSGAMAACLLAQIDDIAKFDTVSKLWRFAGQAVIDDVAERNRPGEPAHRNAHLAALCYNIQDQFIRQQTPLYSDIYYAEKQRLRNLYPEPIPNTRKNSLWPLLYTDLHIHRMAKRKMIKIFLQHLWVQWRTAEGLPVSEPYVQAILGHTHIIESVLAGKGEV